MSHIKSQIEIAAEVAEMLSQNPEWAYERPDHIHFLRECAALGIDPEDSPPHECPRCGTSDLEDAPGMAGERMVYCNRGCGILWVDAAGALAAVL